MFSTWLKRLDPTANIDLPRPVSVEPVLRRVLERVRKFTARSIQYSESNLTAISVIGLVGFPLYYVVWAYVLPQPYENLVLRLVGAFMWLLIFMRQKWPQQLKKYLSIVYYIAVLYSLPFFFTFMMLMNGSSTAWMMSNLAAVFLLILLVDWLSLIIMFMLGSFLGWLSYVYFSTTSYSADILLENLFIYFFALVAGSILNYRTALINKEKMQAMLSVSGSIAHEMRTPLLGIKSGAGGLKNYLPALITGYRQAQDNGLAPEGIRVSHLTALDQVLERIESETDYANSIIDMLLMNAGRAEIDPRSFSNYSMATSIALAIDRYPFKSEGERSILWVADGPDFRYHGAEVLFMHVIFNLIKNALFHVARGGGSRIQISFETDDAYNTMRFLDDGTGIPAHVMPHIFDRFFTTNQGGGGTGIGLSFCRLVMKSFGGDISCHSEVDRYTEFVLRFPKVFEREV